MQGRVKESNVNKLGLPYVIIKANNGITYYCDDRGVEEGTVTQLKVGYDVEFTPYKDKKGKLIATHVKVIKDNTTSAGQSSVISEEDLNKIQAIIIECVKSVKVIPLTKLNIYLLKNDIDYHSFGYKKPKAFLKDNFSDILEFIDEEVNGCPQTLIKLKEENRIIDESSNNQGNSKSVVTVYEEFDGKFNSGDFDGALRSKLIASITPDKLPLMYIEKAVFAANKVLGIDQSYGLSEFSKKIIAAPIASGLFVMKKDSAFMRLGQQESFKKCDSKEFQKYFNSLSQTNTHNTTYLHLAIRFQTVFNKLYLPFYVLAAYSNRKPEVIDEYLKYVQKVKEFENFISFNKVICDIFYREEAISPNYVTKILSISLDFDRFDLFADFSSSILGTTPSFVRWLDEDSIPYDKIVALLSPNGFFKEKVIEKYINYYIYKKLNDGKLNEELLRLLSKIAYAHPIAYLDEILANNSYPNFSRVYKRNILVDNFNEILEYSKKENEGYLLACYVIERFMDDELSVPNEFQDFSRQFVQKTAERLIAEPNSLYVVYPLFGLDAAGRGIIEESFCDYLDNAYPESISIEECKEIVGSFNNNACFFATLYFIDHRDNSSELLQDELLSNCYLTALKNTTNYSKAIKYVKMSKVSPDSKAQEIIRILYMNFKELGLTAKAYEIFDEEFTVDVAEALVLDKFASTNGSPIILMGIYHKKNDLVKVHYLYALYYEITKVGNRTFYSQLHKSDAKVTSMNSHYKAIRMAFTTYNYYDLLDFLSWTSRIIIDGRYEKPFELCKTEIDRLIKNPASKQNWEKILSKLSDDNIRQINTAFGYAVQSVYLLQFYNWNDSEERRIAETYIGQLTQFASYSKATEATSFIALNSKLIEVMPETYVIKLEEFFSKNSSIFAENKEIPKQEIESFYIKLLNKYTQTTEKIYLCLAIKVLDVFENRIAPHFDMYSGFCGSAEDKSALIRQLFKSFAYVEVAEAHDLIYGNNWNCNEEESMALELLKIIYSTEGDELPEALERVSYHTLERFKTDVALLLEEYPKMSHYNSFVKNDESVAYKYLVLQYVMNVAFEQSVYWDMSDKNWDVCDVTGVWNELNEDPIDGIACALGFFKVSYAKQCQNMQLYGIEYIARRYIHLYLIDVYTALAEGREISSISDDYIIELMRKNDHVSLVYDKQYVRFKDYVLELIESDCSSEATRTLLLAMIRGTLCPVITNDKIVLEVIQKTDLHNSLKAMIEMLSYPSFAQSALYLYFNNAEKSKDVFAVCAKLLPIIHKAISSYNSLDDTEKLGMETYIAYASNETDHAKFLKTVITNKNGYFDQSNYESRKDVLVNVIIATVFNYNILRDLGNVIRGEKYSIPENLFKDLLIEMREEPVYWYLCAVKFALNDRKEEATRAFYRVGDSHNIPVLWEKEYNQLKKYIGGDLPKFQTKGIYNDFTSLRETAIKKTLLPDIARNLISDEVELFTAKSALRVFVQEQSTSQEKVRAGSLILAYLYNDSFKFVDELTKKEDGEDFKVKISYNEFLFEYGLLIIKSREITIDQKIRVVIELFEGFKLLNDINQRKFEASLKNSFMDLISTTKSRDDIVSYDLWISQCSDITTIIEKHNLQIDGLDFFAEIMKKCVDFEQTDYTIMEKVVFLESLPEGIYVAPITKNLLNSVKKERERLYNGVMARITTINSTIEDNSVFVLVENFKKSHVSINLSRESQDARFVVSVFCEKTNKTIKFDAKFSGFVDNIRPGQLTGERIRLPEYITKDLCNGDIISIDIVLEVKGAKICNNVEQGCNFTYCVDDLSHEMVSPIQKYGTSTCAFTEDNKGFGRTSDKAWLDKSIPTKGISVIYGPSRVGKSSLLNYIKNYLAVDYKHRMGSFQSSSKNIKVLYVVSHKADYHKMPNVENEVSEKQSLEFLFLAPIRESLLSIIESDMIDSDDKDGDNILRGDAEQILKLIDSELPLDKKLKTISKVLGNNAEIWVLIDEFQQVVERWQITQSALFKELCKQLKESIDNIRYVLCGADELVKLMINRDPVMLMYSDKTRAIGQFSEKDKGDFIAMLCDDMIWGQKGHPFTPEALDYIFSYTGGNAMYGKLIGNSIIDAIENGDLSKRKKIYPYDVSSVIAKMIDEQKSNIAATSAVNEFIGNVTKNLETESQYLVYIADLMMKEPDRTSVESSELYDYFGAMNLTKEEHSLILLCCCVV